MLVSHKEVVLGRKKGLILDLGRYVKIAIFYRVDLVLMNSGKMLR